MEVVWRCASTGLGEPSVTQAGMMKMPELFVPSLDTALLTTVCHCFGVFAFIINCLHCSGSSCWRIFLWSWKWSCVAGECELQ